MTFRLHYLEQQEAQGNVAVQACRREPYLGSPSGVGTVLAQADMSNDHRGSLRNHRSRQKFGHHPSLLGGGEQLWGGLSRAAHTGSKSGRPVWWEPRVDCVSFGPVGPGEWWWEGRGAVVEEDSGRRLEMGRVCSGT